MTDAPARFYNVMLIDDEPNVLSALRRSLAQEGYELECYRDPLEALRRAQIHVFDLFVSDYRMPGMSGVELLSAVRALQPESARLILSGHADFEAVVGAINAARIDRFVAKPWQDEELRGAIREALARRDRQVENRRLADSLRADPEPLSD